MTLKASLVERIMNYQANHQKLLLAKSLLEKTGVATPSNLEVEITDQITAKQQEIQDYYNQVHPDRAVYISNMNQLESELDILVSYNTGVQERNAEKWATNTASYQLQWAGYKTSIDTLESKLKTYLDAATLDTV